MVQIKHDGVKKADLEFETFISHMVQIKPRKKGM